MPLDNLLAGSEYVMVLEYYSGDPYVPADNDLRLVMDSPDGSQRQERIYRVSGGPSSPGVAAVGEAVQFTLDTTLTTTMGAVPGPWSVYVLLGTSPSYADPQYGRTTLTVVTPPGGPV